MHAFIWSKGTGYKDLGAFEPVAIKDAGQVLGFSDHETGSARAVLWDKSTGLKEIGDFSPRDINEYGQVVSEKYERINSRVVILSRTSPYPT